MHILFIAVIKADLSCSFPVQIKEGYEFTSVCRPLTLIAAIAEGPRDALSVEILSSDAQLSKKLAIGK